MAHQYRAIVPPVSNEPTWRSLRRCSFFKLPQGLNSWLFDQSSLTQRLIEASNNQFSVKVLSQTWQLPNTSESIRLNLPLRQRALIREVILYGAGEPWVYARSVLPVRTLTGKLRVLKSLDNRPLGALLFGQPSMKRSAIEIAKFKPDNKVIPDPFNQHILWGRRSVFFLHAKPLLVSEIFLPQFKT